jgi:hypothetical protein
MRHGATCHPVRTASCNDAVQTRDLFHAALGGDPVSASHRFALHCARDDKMTRK